MAETVILISYIMHLRVQLNWRYQNIIRVRVRCLLLISAKEVIRWVVERPESAKAYLGEGGCKAPGTIRFVSIISCYKFFSDSFSKTRNLSAVSTNTISKNGSLFAHAWISSFHSCLSSSFKKRERASAY